MNIDPQTAPSVASLPMYDLPEIRTATNEWWKGIATHLVKEGVTTIPSKLVHDIPLKTLWSDPALLLSQCCGYDITHRYRDIFSAVLTPDYRANGCSHFTYSSLIVVHADAPFNDLLSLRHSIAAINGGESHSGMNAFFSLINRLNRNGRFFKKILVTGSHTHSLSAIQHKTADVAAIDCVTFALLERYRPTALQGIRVLSQTASAPCLPYVIRTSLGSGMRERVSHALLEAFTNSKLASVRDALLIKQGQYFPTHHYECITNDFTFDARLLDNLCYPEK